MGADRTVVQAKTIRELGLEHRDKIRQPGKGASVGLNCFDLVELNVILDQIADGVAVIRTAIEENIVRAPVKTRREEYYVSGQSPR